jgi:predicted Zn-dependent protease
MKPTIIFPAALFAVLFFAAPSSAATMDVPAPVPPTASAVDRQLGAIIQLLQAGRRDEAKRELAAFLITNDHHALALEIQGTIALEENRLDAAEDSLRRSLAAQESTTATAKLGAVRLRRGDLAGGRALLQKALQADPSQPYPTLELARLDAAAGNYGAAIARYRRLVSGDTLTALHIELADACLAAKQYRDARDIVAGRISESLPPVGQAEALRVAVRASIGLKDGESAERDLARLAKLVPATDRRFAVLAAELDALKGNVDAGAARLRAALSEGGPSEPALAFTLARLYAAGGKPNEAVEALDAAIAALPRAADPTVMIREVALVLVERGQTPLAERTVERYAANFPDRPGLGVLAASLLLARGDHVGALARLELIEARHPDTAELHDLRAQILSATGRPRQAIVSARRAARLDPQNIGYWISYSAIAHTIGGHKLMGEVLEQGLKANPGNPDLLFDLALADDEEGRTEEAARKYREILKTDPQHVVTLVALARNRSVAPGGAEEAKQSIAAALQFRPDDPEIKSDYAMVLHRGGDNRAALAVLESLARATPRDAMLNYRLATVYRAAGEQAKARAAGQAALSAGLRGAQADELRGWLR